MSSANNSPLSHADGALLNRLPNRWDVVRLKFAVRVRSVKRNVVPEDRYIGLEHVESWTGRLQNSEDSSANTEGLGVVFEAGDVLFGKLRPYLAKVFLADRPGIASTEFLALQGVRVEAGFLRYCLVSEPFIGAVVAATYGAKMPRANWEDIGNLPQVVPPRQEQRAIADFLDRETAKIDALIAAQERLISLLDEKRQATITHAVTKGLDPNAPMKESGVEWLGKLPEHWTVVPFKRIARVERGRFTHRPRNDPSLYNGPYPFIQTGDVAGAGPDGLIRSFSQTLNDDGLSVSRLFDAGTLAMTIAATIAQVGILGFAACFPDSIVGIWSKRASDQKYLYWLIRSAENELSATAIENTQLNLNVERIGSFPVPVPPLAEQRRISRSLFANSMRLDAIAEKCRATIARLRERRTALITAAVTGKIDVTRQAVTEAAK